ncbi:AAA family ATPase [Candidatus Micrarchaeota archaeon]|nr:AAA family ATPase [Candidatus Micrarchaeota archaeon]
MNLFDKFSSEHSIFKNEVILMPDYLPTDILHRETEIKEIVSSINVLIHGRKGENLFLIGNPGTGKTCCSKYILTELEQHTQRILPIYINCWEHSSRFVILGLIASELDMLIPRRGISVDEVTEKIVEGFNKSLYKGIVVVLDEIDRLFVSKTGDKEVLYDLSRSKENLGVNISIIAISNNRDILAKLDNRIRSSLNPRSLEFKSYDSIALKNILSNRAKLAFYPNILDEEVIPLCAAIGLNHKGDARIAINALWKAAKDAEKKGEDKVKIENVQNIKNSLKTEEEIKKELGKPLDYSIFNDNEKRILKILKKNKEIENIVLYKKLKLTENEKRNVRNILDKFEKLKIIMIKNEGKKRIITFSR